MGATPGNARPSLLDSSFKWEPVTLKYLGLTDKWDEDLQLQLSDSDWSTILAYSPKVSRNASFKLIRYYYFHRGYFTPGKINLRFLG